MKIRSFLLAGLVAIGFTACNDVNEQVIPDGKLQGYITLNVKAPEVRTANTNMPTEVGSPAESAITNVTIVLTNEAGVVQESAIVGMESATKTFKTAVSTGSYYVYALVNYTGGTPSGSIQKVIDVASAEEATKGYKDGSFLMVNAYNGGSTIGATGGVQGTVTSANTESNPLNVAISVDRVAVKIADETNYVSTPPIVDNLSTASNSVVNGVGITGFALLNVNKQFNLIQKWDTNNILSTPLASTPGDIAGQYFLNINDYTKVEMDGSKIASLEDLTTVDDFALGIIYATENRPAYMQLSSGEYTAGMGETTGVIYRVVAQNDGSNVGTFYKYGTTITKNWADIYAIDNTLGETVPAPEQYPALRGKGVKIYENGVMYYTYFIKDVNTNHQLGGKNYYGVFRNSVYKLTINKFTNIGDDVPGGGSVTPEIPNPPIDTETTYIEVTLSINPWVLNTIGIEF